MALVLTSLPAAEPLTLAEAKAHLRLDGSGEDALVASLILTARLHLERLLARAFISQGWTLWLDRWPAPTAVLLPIAPVLGIDAVRIYAADDSAETVPAEDYQLDGQGVPPRLVARVAWPSPTRPANGVEIVFTAGYGTAATDVPQPLRHAMLLLAAHWYEHRELVEVGEPARSFRRR